MSRFMSTCLLVATVLFATSTAALALPPGPFQGKPAFSAGAARGAYVWHDSAGLHTRFTTRGLPHRYTGTVCSTGRIVGLSGVRLEAGDSVSVGPRGRCLSFDFKTASGIDGFDFRAPGGLVTFTLKIDGRPLAKSHIWIGAGKTSPANNPFVLNR